MRLKSILALCLMAVVHASCEAQDWPSLWRSYVAGFMDNQVRVIDHDAGDRTTSEGQAYGLFFALVAWEKVAASVPVVISESAPHGFVSDWTDFKAAPDLQATPGIGSYDAIRVYLWAGMLDTATPNQDSLLKSILGTANYLHTNPRPPAKVRPDGSIEDPNGPVGFSAALLPYAAALHEDQIENQQMSPVQSQLKPQAGLFGAPARYYDQNLALFGLGFLQHQFSFDSEGALRLKWKSD